MSEIVDRPEGMAGFFDARADGYEAHIGEGFQEGAYHIDIPFTVETQIKLLLEAGFATAGLLWREGHGAIFAAGRG